jgi:hypothetical protein
MRTIRCGWTVKVDMANELNIETEVIVDNDEDVHEAGRDAILVLYNFRQGILERMEQGLE